MKIIMFLLIIYLLTIIIVTYPSIVPFKVLIAKREWKMYQENCKIVKLIIKITNKMYLICCITQIICLIHFFRFILSFTGNVKIQKILYK